MPVRKVSNRGGNVVGRFPSLKMGRMIAFESLLERDFIYLLDYDAHVERFEEQPLTIEYVEADRPLHYTPDFQVLEAGQCVLVECKPESFVESADNQRKFAVAREWCAARGWNFRVVTDTQIRAGFRLNNVKRLTPYARLVLDPVLSYRIEDCLRDGASVWTLQTLVQALSPDAPDRVIAGVLHLVFHHRLEMPLDRAPLSGQLPIALRAVAP